MARKAIYRDLHAKEAKHTKAYSVVNGLGQLKVESTTHKVSSVPQPKEPPDAQRLAKDIVKMPETPPVEDASIVEVKSEEVSETKSVDTQMSHMVAKKPITKKSPKRGRPHKSHHVKTEEKEETKNSKLESIKDQLS